MTVRRGASLALAGQAGVRGLRAPTPLELAAQVKQLMWRPSMRRLGRGAARDRHALALVQVAAPGAVETFGVAAVLSLLRKPGTGVCRWEVAEMVAALTGEPMPKRDAATRALLGPPCGRCEARWSLQARVEQVRAEDPAARAAATARAAPKPTGGTLQQRTEWWAAKLGIPPDTSPPPYYRRRGRPGAAARRQPPSPWNGPTLRRSLVPRGRPR